MDLVYVGVDVSSKSLDVTWQFKKEAPGKGVFENAPAGIAALIEKLTKKGRHAQVVLEATGVYHIELARAIHQAPRAQVMVLNPKAARDFASSLMTRGKTDSLDSSVLMEYSRRMDFVPWVPPSETVFQLHVIARRIHAVTDQLVVEKNRFHAAEQDSLVPAFLKKDIETSIAFTEERIDRLRDGALQVISTDADLQEKYDLLMSIVGIGKASAIRILGELSVLPADMTAPQWVAYAGLDPRPKQSGTSLRGKTVISKVGNSRLRAALFLPAMSASRFQPNVKAFYEKLQARGKAKMQGIVAIMRKMLHSIWGMFHHRTKFDGQKFFFVEPEATEKNAENGRST